MRIRLAGKNTKHRLSFYVSSQHGTILADVRSGVRMTREYPALSLVAVLTIGLGIGTQHPVFSVVNGGLVKGAAITSRRRIVSWSRQPSSSSRASGSVQDLAVFEATQTPSERVGALRFRT